MLSAAAQAPPFFDLAIVSGTGREPQGGAIENEQPLTGSLIFWWRRMDSNHRRQSQQIYSLSPLATWVLLRMQLSGRRWSWWTDSNPRPADYKSAALPAELHQRSSFRIHNDGYYSSRRRVCQQFFKKERKKNHERMERSRQEEHSRPRGRSGAACAGESCTPATPILSWTARRCARTAWAVTPGGISPPSCGGWAGTEYL